MARGKGCTRTVRPALRSREKSVQAEDHRAASPRSIANARDTHHFELRARETPGSYRLYFVRERPNGGSTSYRIGALHRVASERRDGHTYATYVTGEDRDSLDVSYEPSREAAVAFILAFAGADPAGPVELVPFRPSASPGTKP